MSTTIFRGHVLAAPLDLAALPLSFTQECLLADIPDGTVVDSRHTLTEVIGLQLPYDRSALVSTVEILMERHRALRFTLHKQDGCTVNRLREILPSDIIQVVNGANLKGATSAGFQLYDAPLLRLIVYVDGPTKWQLGIQAHHCISDGRSMEILKADIQDIYAGVTAGHWSQPTLPLQFDEHIRSLRNEYEKGELDEDIQYWKELIHRCQGHPPVQPSEPTGRMHVRSVAIETDLYEVITAAARAMRVSVFGYFAHGLMTALDDMGAAPKSFETTFSGRWSEELESCIGYFSHNAIVATEFLQERTKQAQLSSLGRQIFESLSCQRVPMQYLFKKKEVYTGDSFPARGYRIKLQMQNFRRSTTAGDLPSGLERVFKTDFLVSRAIRLFLFPFDNGILLQVQYRSDLFSDADMAKLLNQTLTALSVSTL